MTQWTAAIKRNALLMVLLRNTQSQGKYRHSWYGCTGYADVSVFMDPRNSLRVNLLCLTRIYLFYNMDGEVLPSSKQRFHSVARFPTRSVPLIVGVHARNRSLQTLPARLFSQSRRIIHPACGEFWPGLASVSVSRLRGFCPARSAIFEGSVPQNQIPAFRHSRSMPEFQSRSSR